MKYKISDGKLKILFVYQVASFWPSWDSLYRSCIEDKNIEVKLFRIDGSQGDRAQMEHSEDFLIKNGIPYEEFTYERVMSFNPDYMIYQTPYDKGHRPIETWTARYRKEGIRICYIPYGIEISDTEESRYKHFSLSVVLNSFAVFVLSEEIKKEYEKFCINAKAVKALGLPRFDALTKHYELSKDCKAKANGRKIILWKSHFPKIFVENEVRKQATPDLDEYIKFLDYIKGTPNLFFIFMPHPKFTDQTIDSGLLPKAQYLLNTLRGLQNVYVDESDDYRNSLVNADAVIVDRSAVMVEAAVKNVPILYMSNMNYIEPMTTPIQNLLDSYYHGTTANEMIDFCECFKQGKDPQNLIRKKAFSKCVPYLDGKCAERIKEYMLEASKVATENVMVLEINPNSKVIIFGAGAIGSFCVNRMLEGAKQADIIAFADNNQDRWNEYYMGYPIISPDKILETPFDYLVVASDRYYREFYLQIIELGVPTEKIINFDQFIVLMRY